jgi:hypothetical protein
MLQNPKRVGQYSDGRQHSHGYCFAMGLPFVPCFFQSAQFLDEQGREELRLLIALYKTCREDLFTSTTYPIGDIPDNASWSGFQMVSTANPDSGHLLIFRELHNEEPRKSMRLKFLAGRTVTVVDLRSGKTSELRVTDDGYANFPIEQPADYSLLKYSIQ